MKYLKSTLESFKENELLSTHKLKIKGGIPVEWIELDEDIELDENGFPVNNAGPLGGSASSQSTAPASTLGNSSTGAGSTPPIVVG